MRKFVIFLALLSTSCSAQPKEDAPLGDCRFLHTAAAQPVFDGERSKFSVQLLDDRAVIEGGSQCEIEGSGFPVDLVWLYPFSKHLLIVIEQSALGTKLNLVDAEKCKVLESRSTEADYVVEDNAVWAYSENCGDDKSKCARTPLFQLDKGCSVN